MPKRKIKKPSPYLFVLYDKWGHWFDSYDTHLDAVNDAVGPIFYNRGKETFTVRTYKLLKRSEEPKGVPVKAHLRG